CIQLPVHVNQDLTHRALYTAGAITTMEHIMKLTIFLKNTSIVSIHLYLRTGISIPCCQHAVTLLKQITLPPCDDDATHCTFVAYTDTSFTTIGCLLYPHCYRFDYRSL
ncbi:MAG TPA: hypothetical protein PLZ38_08345, partial [Spirochaetota bacterium]|nr:hypothetical protein [Spirochaetota bacterium]